MHPVSADPARPSAYPWFFLALGNLADDICTTSARLVVYVGALTLIGILMLAVWQRIDDRDSDGWLLAGEAVPEFALKRIDQLDRTATYVVRRHPEGGRRDIIRWGETSNEPALAELEIYQLGPEAETASAPAHQLAGRMALKDDAALEPAGLIDSKFGPIDMLRATGAKARQSASCLGFLKEISEPALRISGWSCHGATSPAQRAVVGCMVNRLSLLAGDHEPELAALFARADLKPDTCGAPIPRRGVPDWVTSADNPRLRGAL
jgi:hypothetical protein